MRNHSLASFFRIKYCGFQRAQDIVDALEVGAEAIGLNFYPRSPRYVEPEAAAEFSQLIDERSRGKVVRVGIFVNPTIEDFGKRWIAAHSMSFSCTVMNAPSWSSMKNLFRRLLRPSPGEKITRKMWNG